MMILRWVCGVRRTFGVAIYEMREGRLRCHSHMHCRPINVHSRMSDLIHMGMVEENRKAMRTGP